MGGVCNDCQKETDDSYMIHNELWASLGLTHGIMCVLCLEKRLGRQLTASDFSNVMLNDMAKNWKFKDPTKINLAKDRLKDWEFNYE